MNVPVCIHPRHDESVRRPFIVDQNIQGPSGDLQKRRSCRSRHNKKFPGFSVIERRQIDFGDPALRSLNRKHRPFPASAKLPTKRNADTFQHQRKVRHSWWPYRRQDASTSDTSSSVRERTRSDERKRSSEADRCLISLSLFTLASPASKIGRNMPRKNGS